MGCNANKSPWPDGDVELRRLAAEGNSASQIARQLGRSRNAVISRCHRKNIRLGFGPLSTPQQRLRAGDAAKRIAPYVPGATGRGRISEPRPTPLTAGEVRKANAAEAAKLFDLSAATSTAVTLMAARDGQCRWPIGEPGTDSFRFCGCKIARGSYCQHHAARAFQPSQARRDAKDYAGTDARAEHTFRLGRKVSGYVQRVSPLLGIMDDWT